ncbi:MAG: apolipoprotein N-acyltransferase [Rhodoferax sp.]|nr:apolipoprotein N-acyltransferase [Rhodoferax sp.]
MPFDGPLPRTMAAWPLKLAWVTLAALASALSLAWPFDLFFTQGEPLWWLQSLAMAGLVGALQGLPGWRHSAWLGGLFSTVGLSATFWWLYVAMHTYGGLHAVLAVAAIVALAAALSLYYAAACALYWRFARSHSGRSCLAFAALWTLAELARGTWLTGFGWGAAAYAHIDGPLAAYAPWAGAYGLGAVAAWLAATLAMLARAGWGQRMALVLVLALGHWLPSGVGPWSNDSGTLSVTLLQGDIPQDEKFETGSGVPMALQWYGEHLLAAKSALVVAPETAIPVLPQQLPDAYWDALEQRFSSGKQAALVGIPLGSHAAGYTNSVIALRPGPSDLWRYEKHHLVPFGEFIPPWFKWFTALMNIPLGDFNRGPLGQPSFAWQGQRLAPNICYEDLFGEELGARFEDAARAPTIFVNVSNIGWFGNTIAIDQHLHISRMRALEFERPFVRATNTGATAIVDHRARVVAALPRHTRGVLVGEVQGRNGLTPFARWVAALGLWPIWLSAIALLAWLRSQPKRGTES